MSASTIGPTRDSTEGERERSPRGPTELCSMQGPRRPARTGFARPFRRSNPG